MGTTRTADNDPLLADSGAVMIIPQIENCCDDIYPCAVIGMMREHEDQEPQLVKMCICGDDLKQTRCGAG